MKKINLIIFGIGNVGSTLIHQILEQKEHIAKAQGIELAIPLIANSTHVFLSDVVSNSWALDFKQFSQPYAFKDILEYLKAQNFKNVIAIDATASTKFTEHYIDLIDAGCHIVAANKMANTLSLKFYDQLREKLKKHNKHFLYETNVGAGLPIVETIRNLHNSGEQITKIRGVFSGSLSYVFNTFSEETASFSSVLTQASTLGLTEPDPREDLSGNDVARKLLILARELDLPVEFNHINIESLVPKQLNGKTTSVQFKQRIKELDQPFQNIKQDLQDHEVLRYIGELNVAEKRLEVKLVSEKKGTPLGQLRGSDSIFEIFSHSYNQQPLVIQGAGAGKDVTARGVFSDVIKIANVV